MMNEFLKVFGDVKVYEIVIWCLALAFLFKTIKGYNALITKRHDQEQEGERQLTNIADNVKQNSIDIELLKQANLATLNYHLFAECEKVINHGYVKIMELDKIKRLYSAYHALGGNGTGTKLFNDVLALPVKPIKEDNI